MQFGQKTQYVVVQAYWGSQQPQKSYGLIVNNQYLITTPSTIVKCTPYGKEYYDLINITSPNTKLSFDIKNADKGNVHLQGNESQVLILKFQTEDSNKIEKWWIADLLETCIISQPETINLNDEIYLPMISQHIDQIANQVSQQVKYNQTQFSADLQKKLTLMKRKMSKILYDSVCSLKDEYIKNYFVQQNKISLVQHFSPQIQQNRSFQSNKKYYRKQIDNKKYEKVFRFQMKKKKYFINILLQNTYNIYLHLAKKNEQKNIAKLQLQKLWSNLDQNQPIQIIVQQGDYRFTRQNRGISLSLCNNLQCDQLWKLGRKYVFLWMRSLAMAIQQLEEIGIYHADLFLRNTILTHTQGKAQTFKVTNFDYAFVISKNNLKGYTTTEKIMQFWLENTENERQIIKYVFRNATKEKIYMLFQLKHTNSYSIDRKIHLLMEILAEHMKKNHLQQYAREIITIFKQFKLQNEQISQAQVQKIRQYIGKLLKQKNYTNFLDNIQKLACLDK